MVKSSPELMVIREVLEGTLAPEVAAATLFTALEAVNPDPVTRPQWAGFVRDHLREAVKGRCGDEMARDIAARILVILGGHDEEPPQPGKKRRSQAPTSKFPTTDGPIRMLIVAASPKLARLLKGALGSRIAPMILNDPRRMAVFVDDFDPMLILIDLTDPPRHVESLPKLSKSLPDSVITAIWDEGSTAGKSLTEAYEREGRRWMWVDRREGADPLIDLIRATQTPGA